MTESPSYPITFQVLAASTERLDRFLADQLSLSRTQAARLVGEGAVRVNDEVARASRCLAHGDLVRVEIPETAPRREITPLPLALQVVFEDEHLLVIDKPAGLVVHPAPGHWDDTLVNALVARGAVSGRTDRRADTSAADDVFDDDGEGFESEEPPSVSPSVRLSDSSSARPSVSDRPGIVHRLDKDTSGLMVVAKTEAAHRKLSHALGLRRIEREYAALTWGHIDSPLEIDAPIGRNPRNRQQMAVVKTGREARTHVTPIARFALCDLLRVKLFSGRTHQIRVHLAHVGHPVIGDPAYGGGGHKRMTGHDRNQALALERETPRQALHAARLRFAHPETRAWLEFESDWPDDLRPALAAAASDPNLLARPKVLEYLGFRA